MATNSTANVNSVASTPIPHISRVFHNYPGANYVLPSDDREVARLKLQHDVLKAAFDGNILLAPFNSSGAYFVLDSGVGSGVWALDIAAQMSSSTIIHGIDIESRLFPLQRPTNASFSVNSITALPAEWTGKYNYVHQRLLVAALRHSEWKKALQEMSRVLQPGGWVQLGEVGTWHAGPVTERHISMLHALFKSRELLLDVSTEMPSLLKEAGFTNIRMQKRTIPLGAWAGQFGADARDNFMGVFRGMKTPILYSGGLGFVRSEEEFDNFLNALEKEWNETRGAEIEFCIFYAQSADT